MPTNNNTSYRVHVQDTNQAEVDSVNIENGAMLRTDDALYMGHNNQNVVIYPQDVTTIGGWERIDDTVYTSSSKLTLSDGVQVVLPNNGGSIVRSHPSINFYNTSTQKILGINENDVYVMTWAFKASASNANQTYIEYNLEGSGQISRVAGTLSFPRGNDVEHIESIVMQYYSDSTFVSDGVQLKVKSVGGDSLVWDTIYFIQRTQNADFS
jgi:hypothetical protein